MYFLPYRWRGPWGLRTALLICTIQLCFDSALAGIWGHWLWVTCSMVKLIPVLEGGALLCVPFDSQHLDFLPPELEVAIW